MPRTYPTGECTSCGETKLLAARGLCRTCYQRWRKNGSTEYARKFRNNVCSVEGCYARAHGQGLCNKHLLRLRRTGTVEEGRKYVVKNPAVQPRTQHDLYPIWAEMNRKNNPRPAHSSWVGGPETFDQFVADVGERPSRRHRLHPSNPNSLLGPDNFEWREALIERHDGETLEEYNARYRKEHRRAYGTSYHNSEMLRKYGITRADYVRRFDDQKGLCALCGKPETDLDKNGAVKALAVDHDHATGKVRALLCQACNTGLGKFRDDTRLLALAITYLAKHAPAT